MMKSLQGEITGKSTYIWNFINMKASLIETTVDHKQQYIQVHVSLVQSFWCNIIQSNGWQLNQTLLNNDSAHDLLSDLYA